MSYPPEVLCIASCSCREWVVPGFLLPQARPCGACEVMPVRTGDFDGRDDWARLR